MFGSRSIALLCLLGVGCADVASLSVEPPSIAHAEWRAPLLVTGLSPSDYLDRDVDRLRSADPLSIRIGGVQTELMSVRADGVVVRLMMPLSIGSHGVIVEARGSRYEDSDVLRVTSGGPMDAATDSLADSSLGDGRVDGSPDSAPPDSGSMDAAVDSGVPDTGRPDSGAPDTTPPDTGTPDVCGDRVLGPTEDCDDGNTDNGDGCTRRCALETTRFACPGNPLIIRLGGPQLYRGTTSGATSSVRCSGGIGRGPDRVFEIAPQYTGWLNLRLTPVDSYDAALMTRSECPGSSQFFCEDSNPAGGVEVIDGTVNSARRYMVIASGAGAGEAGEFIIRFEGRTSR